MVLAFRLICREPTPFYILKVGNVREGGEREVIDKKRKLLFFLSIALSYGYITLETRIQV